MIIVAILIPVIAAGALILAVDAAVITVVVSRSRQKHALIDMSSVTGECVQKVKSLGNMTEQALTHYGQASQITDLLRDPDNKELAETAQKYTEEYSQTIENLEGIYASEYATTRVLTHTAAAAIGIVTRENPETRMQLQNLMLEAGNGAYNAGIMLSPASYRTILGMYKLIYYDEDKLPIGYTGIGVFVEPLFSDVPDICGVDNETFALVNAGGARYIYNSDPEHDMGEVKQEEIKALCSKLTGTDELTEGTLEYKDDSGKHLVSYAYMPDYNCLIMLDGTT